MWSGTLLQATTELGLYSFEIEGSTYLRENHIEYQRCTTIANMVHFYLIQKGDVKVLKEQPPVLEGTECLVGTPKFIQPNYVLEIGIVEINMFDDPEFFISEYVDCTY